MLKYFLTNLFKNSMARLTPLNFSVFRKTKKIQKMIDLKFWICRILKYIIYLRDNEYKK